MEARQERTYLMIKPDGVQRNLTSKIISRFEDRGYKLVGMKLMRPSKELFEQHYADLKDKPFFPGLISYVMSGPVVGMVWQGTNVVKTARKMLGETKPLESNPGTIRGDFCIDVGRNIIHGSDSIENAQKEINLWFKPEELFDYDRNNDCWVYE